MDSNKLVGIIGAATIVVFLSGTLGWDYYSDKKAENEATIKKEMEFQKKLEQQEEMEDEQKEQEEMETFLDETNIEDDTETTETIDEDQVYRYMKYQFDVLTDNGENYNADYHDSLVANMAAQKFGITTSEANDIYGRKDYENVFGN